MTNNADSKHILIRDMDENVMGPIEREADRQRRSTQAQLKLLLEQAAARIVARERRTAEKQAAQA